MSNRLASHYFKEFSDADSPQDNIDNKEEKLPRGYRRKRLGEIMSILNRHEITKGLTPEKLRLIIEDLGPTFVKFGQIISMRSDLLPEAYCKELEKLRSDVKPMSFAIVKKQIETEYGDSMWSLFSKFDKKPLGSASIAQVHHAILKNGDEVVVKVQRPGIYEVMAMDIGLLHRAISLIKITGIISDALDLNMLLDEMWFAARQEMDFLIEARHADQFADYNEDISYVACPKMYHQYSTSKMLVMEYVNGISVGDLDALRAAKVNLNTLADNMAENYIKQVIDDAFFHADPHPGNIIIRDGVIVWIDTGMMGTLSRKDSNALKNMISAVATQNAQTLKNALLEIGDYSEPIDHIRMYADVDNFLSRYGNIDLESIELGTFLTDLLGLASDHHISVPKGISMFMRSCITIESVIALLNPHANLVSILMKHLYRNELKNLDLKATLFDFGRNLYTGAQATLEIPTYVISLIRTVLHGDTNINIKLSDYNNLMRKIDLLVSRIVTALIIVGLLIGSSFIATTNMKPEILDIPALGLIGFVFAMGLAFYLIFNIFITKR